MKLRAYLIRVGQRWALVPLIEPGHEVRFDTRAAAARYAGRIHWRVTRRAGWDRADILTPPTPVFDDELSPAEHRQLSERLAVAQRARVRHVRWRRRGLGCLTGWLYRRAVSGLR